MQAAANNRLMCVWVSRDGQASVDRANEVSGRGRMMANPPREEACWGRYLAQRASARGPTLRKLWDDMFVRLGKEACALYVLVSLGPAIRWTS